MKKQLLFLVCTLIISMQAWTGNQYPDCQDLGYISSFKNAPRFSAQIGAIYNTGRVASNGHVDGDPRWRPEIISGYTLDTIRSYDGTTYAQSMVHQLGIADYAKRFEIVHDSLATDPNTCNQLTLLPPDANIHWAVRIGNTYNSEMEKLIYTMEVSESNSLFSFWYAWVIESPENPHGILNPMIDFSFYKKNTITRGWDSIAPCMHYGCIASDDAKHTWGTTECIADTSLGVAKPVIYKSWEKVVVNLLEYTDDSIRIEVTNRDCLATGHYSYCYFAPSCGSAQLVTSSECSQDAGVIATAEAPEGMTSYQWYVKDPDSDNSSVISGIRGTSRILDIKESEFEVYNDLSKVVLICEMTSGLNPNIPCTTRTEISVNNDKPQALVDTVYGDNLDVTLINKSILISLSGDVIDTARTFWVIVEINDTIYTHDELYYQFSTSGNKKITLHLESRGGCITEKDFILMVGTPEQFYITLITNNSDYGNVIGEGTYEKNAVASVQAIPNQGYKFLNWTKNDSIISVDTVYYFMVTEDIELIANFSPNVEIIPDSTSANVTWSVVEGAESYTIIIYSDEERTQIVYLLEFDREGNLLLINQGKNKSTKSDGFSYIIENLMEGTTYYYTIIAYDINEKVLNEESNSFTTKGGEANIKQMPEFQINIYPNPTSGKLTIDNGESPIGEVDIFDINGKKLFTINSQLTTVEIDISHFAKGIYILQMEKKQVKVVKE